MLTFVRSMMEWLGGTITKDEVSETGKKRKRPTADDDQSLAALRFPCANYFFCWYDVIYFFPQVPRIFLFALSFDSNLSLQQTQINFSSPCIFVTRLV